MPLNDSTLAAHAARGRVRTPSYNRAAITAGVVHIGMGGFHRAHQAVYLEEIAERGLSNDWGVTGVTLRRSRMRDLLVPQDGLYTCVERDESRTEARVVGIVGRCLFAADQSRLVIGALAAPTTRIVTLTVTGGAYRDITAMATADDAVDAGALADLVDPSRPATVVGYLVEGLRLRRRAGLPPFTVLSCDNLQDNGRVTKDVVQAFARWRDPGLADWIEAEGAFPSSVVDRITPKPDLASQELVRDAFGIADRSPVIAEPYSQWIIEDDFCCGRPPLEEVGAQLVADVRPYADAKKRVLNGAHCALGYVGLLSGCQSVAEAMGDPLLRRFLRTLMETEIAPSVPRPPGVDLRSYIRTVLQRFANPNVGDQLARLCARGSTKMPAYLLPSAADAVRARRPHSLLAIAVAAWFMYLRERDDAGLPIEVEDARAEELQSLLGPAGSDPRRLLGEGWLFGDLAGDAGFADAVETALESLEDQGVTATLQRALATGTAQPTRA
jgi:fructuronate reductase/mannitol 2-dehydrogenase